MRYFRALSEGTISRSHVMVTWLWHDDYQIAYRDRVGHPGFINHNSPLPIPSLYGQFSEITEEEARRLDPELFDDGVIWQNYEAFKPHDQACEERRNTGKQARR